MDLTLVRRAAIRRLVLTSCKRLQRMPNRLLHRQAAIALEGTAVEPRAEITAGWAALDHKPRILVTLARLRPSFAPVLAVAARAKTRAACARTLELHPSGI